MPSPLSETPDHKIGLRPAEAARLLGVSERTLRTLTKEQGIPCVRFGRKLLLYPRDLLITWLGKRALRD